MDRELQKNNVHKVQVVFYKNGQTVAKNVDVGDIELLVGDEVVKLGELLLTMHNRIVNLENNLGRLARELNGFVNQTNSNISAIMSAIKVKEESEDVY